MLNTNMSRTLLLLSIIFLLFLTLNTGISSADEDLVAYRGETISISVTLLQNGSYGDPVQNQIIEFYDQTNNLFLGFNITDSNGLALLDWNIPTDYILGPTTLNATFHGNESLHLSPSYQSILLNILASTEIIAYYHSQSFAPDDILSFSVILIDDLDNPLANRNLSVYSNNILLANTVTNSSGGASFSIHCNSSWSILGENRIHIIHEQDLLTFHGYTETIFPIEIEKLQTIMHSNFSEDTILLNDNLSLEVELSSPDGGISSNLEVQIDNSLFGSIGTDFSGKDTFSIHIDERFSLGHHTLDIIYNGSDRYSTSILTIEFDVLSFAIIKITTSTVIIESNSSLPIFLSDTLGRHIDGTLTVSDLTSGKNASIQIPFDLTEFNIELLIFAPVGLHSLMLNVNNPFLINNSMMLVIDVWSQPEIRLQDTNILHFASPNQELNFICQLSDWSGNLSSRPVHLLYNGTSITSSITDEFGIVSFRSKAPIYEGFYNISIIYKMNTTNRELTTKIDYNLIISITIPVTVELDYYQVIPPLQKVVVYLHVQCLNGSFLQNIPIKVHWISIDRYSLTQKDGTTIVHLPVPHTRGNYSLYYEIEEKHNIAATFGFIQITISTTDVLSSQGIGINGFAFSILTSFVIVAIPLVKRKLYVV